MVVVEKVLGFVLALSAVTALSACNQNLSGSHSKHQILEEDTGVTAQLLEGKPVRERVTAASKSVVLIEMTAADRSPIAHCTGTLIDRYTVLTAAHCFDITRIPEIRGFNLIFANSLAEKNQLNTRIGRAYSIHPHFNREKNLDHDVAVLFFRGGAPVGFEPVNIDQDTKADYSNEVVYVYGYGRTEDENRSPFKGVLHKGAMKIDDYFTRFSDRYWTQVTSESFMCKGDSGGPQFYHKGDVLKIVGINSGTLATRRLPDGSYSCRAQGQATKVAPFAPWIKYQAAEMRKKYF